jgi:hypothetical protein
VPTVHKLGELRIVIYLNDHRPAHVHVYGAGHEAVFNLNCPKGPPILRENYGFSQRKLTRIARDIRLHLRMLCLKWGDLHGDH